MFNDLFSEKSVEQALEILKNEIPVAIWETFYVTVLSTFFAVVIGLPLGVLLVVGEKNGVLPLPRWLMTVLNVLINLLRSVPFLILMIMVIPLSRLIVGTSIGTVATIVPLVVAAFPFVARLVETSLRELNPNIIEAAQSMGASPFQIIVKVMIPESVPSLLSNLTTALTTVLGYSAMSGAIGGGGLGKIAIYDGYPSMQRALQEMIRGKLTSIQRIKASEGELSGSDLVTNVLQRDMEKIRMAMDQTDGSEFSHVVDIIAQAKHIYIVGFRSSSFLAGYLNFYFRLIYDNVTQVQGGAAGTFDQLFRVGPGDVVIAICFPRYSELALKTVQYAKDRGATIIGVTDSEMSPVYQMSSGSLLVRNEMISFVDSLAAPMSMLNALILAAAHKQGTDISATFNELEHVWDRFGIFGKVEDE